MKIMETFTTDRLVRSDTSYRYAPVLLTGGVALIGEEVTKLSDCCGGIEAYRYIFQFLKTGQSQIQFVKYRPFDLSNAVFEDVLTFTVEPGESNGLMGGWSEFTDLAPEDEEVFKQVIGLEKGVDYKVFKVSKQIVNGTNYRFICEGNPVVKDSNIFPAIVKVYQLVNGNAVLTGIERIVL